MELCRKIGYDHQGMMSLPPGHEKCIAALTALAVDPARRQQIVDSRRNYKVAHWHYSPRHRMKDHSSGKWMLRKPLSLDGGKYIDRDRKRWDFAPPNHSLQQYIEDEINGFGWRGGYDDSIPQWVQVAVDFKKASESVPSPGRIVSPTNSESSSSTNPTTPRKPSSTPRASSSSTKSSTSKCNTPQTPLTSPRPARMKRVSPDTEELDSTKEELRIPQVLHQSALDQIEEQNNKLKFTTEELNQVKFNLSKSLEDNVKLRDVIDKLQQQRRRYLSYEDLMPGGILD
jgi:hypothetical protein